MAEPSVNHKARRVVTPDFTGLTDMPRGPITEPDGLQTNWRTTLLLSAGELQLFKLFFFFIYLIFFPPFHPSIHPSSLPPSLLELRPLQTTLHMEFKKKKPMASVWWTERDASLNAALNEICHVLKRLLQ